MAGLAKGRIGEGGDRGGSPEATVAVDACGTWIAPAGGVPPTGGGWWLYHSFSTQFTTGAPPCPRTHSEKREPTELPSAGLISAPPSDTAIQPIALQRTRTM